MRVLPDDINIEWTPETLQNAAKALKCLGSHSQEGECYADYYNYRLHYDQFDKKERLDDLPMGCQGTLQGYQKCPYHQEEFGCCWEDGETWWLKELGEYLDTIIEKAEGEK